MTRYLWMAAGSVNVGLGAVGMVLPLLPTTPFLLLAAVCYAKGSPRLHDWLVNHRVFGAYIRSYRNGQGMPRRAKMLTLALLWVTLGGSAWWMGQAWMAWTLAGVGAGVTLLILWLARPRPPVSGPMLP